MTEIEIKKVEDELRSKFRNRLSVVKGIAFDNEKSLGPVDRVLEKLTDMLNDENAKASSRVYSRVMMSVLIDYRMLDMMFLAMSKKVN